MNTPQPGIVLACTTCELTVGLAAEDDEAVRAALGAFFVVHATHRTWIDVSAAGRTLPRPRRADADDLARTQASPP